ncbi:MAG: ABC transporter permease, partial [Chitinophagaceae bacterium]
MKTNSTSSSIVKRLFKNKLAIIGLIIIILNLIIAIFAYGFALDSTINANRIIPEIGSKKQGSQIQFLLVKKNNEELSNSIVNKLFTGTIDAYQYLPIQKYYQKNDSIFFEKYIDENITEKGAMHLQQVAKDPVIKQTFLLGTDKFGRDMLSRLFLGTRVSLGVGLIAVIISLSIGIVLGAFAGYFGGFIDACIMWLTNVIWSIPTLLLVFAITLVLGKGFWQVFIAVGLTMWVNIARLVRGQVLSIKNLEYVQAATVLGFSHFRIIFKHILPNILGPVMVIAASNFAAAIVVEAGLSFLGVGVQPPQPSWGLMIKENYNFIITNRQLLALAPGIAIMQ